MNSRARKRRIYARYRLRDRFMLTTEDRAWLDEVPVGREFGSKDYERLAILDAFTQGRMDAQKAIGLLGIDQDALAAMVEKDGLTEYQFVDEVEVPVVSNADKFSAHGRNIARRLDALALQAKNSAENSCASIDDSISFINASNRRIAEMEAGMSAPHEFSKDVLAPAPPDSLLPARESQKK